MEPYYSHGGITIFHGDCLDVLCDLEAGTIGSIVTDPPFSSGGRQNAGKRTSFTKLAGWNGAPTKWDEEDWVQRDSMGADAFQWFQRHVGMECFRLVEDKGHAYVFIDWRNLNLLTPPWESCGWQWRSLIVWTKNRQGMGSFWRSCHELCPVFTKGTPREMENGSFYNVIEASPPHDKKHPTEKPESVITQLVRGHQSELPVLDPFMGSGTTLRAAKDLGRKAIGIEIEERYCEIAANRLRQEVLF